MKDRTNVIPFPKPTPTTASPNPRPAARASVKKPKWNASLPMTVCSMVAIALATGASNTALFKKADGVAQLSSISESKEMDRGIASVEPQLPEDRDSKWEKSVAEGLASVEVRDLASVSVGHEASVDEKVRYGVLERKYTVLRDLKRNEIESIVLQGSGSEPSLVPDRAEFLGKYGKWLSEKYVFSELKSSQPVKEGRRETFTLFDSSRRPYAIASFDLDSSQRLLALHVIPL